MKIENKVRKDHGYCVIVDNILQHEEFQKRKKFNHHGAISVYEHSLKVSYYGYLFAKEHNMDFKSVAIGGLLHDFYYHDWHVKEERPFFKKHGFVHAHESYENSLKYFPELINPLIKDIITKHMFPLNIHIPSYKESWLITLVDKYVALEFVVEELKKIPLFCQKSNLF